MPNHHKYIDALRGLAAAAVLFTHTPLLVRGLPWRVGHVASLGAHGVQLFFMLSAITLASSWDKRSEMESAPARAFYIRRLFRIAPMFWLAGLFYIAVNVFMTPFWHNGTVNGFSILLTALFAHGWSPATINAVVPGGWSIAGEMTFYLAFPLLAVSLTDLKRCLAFLAFAVLFALIANEAASYVFDSKQDHFLQFLYFWLPNQLPVFALGFVTYRLTPVMRAAGSVHVALLFGFAIAVGAFLVIKPLAYLSTISHPSVWRDLVAGLAFMALILALSARPIPLLVNRVTIFLGKVSFSSYLVQFALLQGALLSIGVIEGGRGARGIVLLLGLFLIFLPLNAAIAALTYAMIEKPFLKMGQRFADKVAFPDAETAARMPA